MKKQRSQQNPTLLHNLQMELNKRIVIILLISIASTIIVISWFLQAPFVSDKAKIAAVTALRDRLGSIPEEGTLIIVDYTQPSQTKRLAVMNLENGRLLFHTRVAHGKNSGGVYAHKLSNIAGSLQSSAGLFKITDEFNGKHGKSLRLMGLDPELNSNSKERGIIIHSAKYVSLKSIIANWKKGFYLGRSAGCFVLSNDSFNKLNQELIRPAYLYSFHNDNDYSSYQSLPLNKRLK